MTNRPAIIASEAARQAVFHLIEKSFGFGRDEAFQPMWPQVIDLILHALDEPRHGDPHYRIFRNMLHGVTFPEPAAFVFGRGLKERLKTIRYTRRSRGLIKTWLKEHGQ